MSTQKALYLLEPKGKFAVKERDIQEPGSGEVLVEVQAAGLNPIEWKIQAFDIVVQEYPAILGFDSAGIVKKVGAGVANVAVGDRVYVCRLYARQYECLHSVVCMRAPTVQISAMRRSSSTLSHPPSLSLRCAAQDHYIPRNSPAKCTLSDPTALDL